MAANKSVRDTFVIVLVVCAVAITIMANLLADRRFARLDLTAEKRYTLTQPFKNILGELDDVLKVTYYTTKEPPEWFKPLRRDILDKFKEVETAAGGKVVIDVLDPGENRELDDKLKELGLAQQVPDFGEDSMSVSKLYSAVELAFKSKEKVYIPLIQSGEDVEYQLASKIKELLTLKKPAIAILIPPSMRSPNPAMRQSQNGFEWIQDGAWDPERKYDIRPLELTDSSSVPQDTALVVIARPKELNERQRYELVKYLAGGGHVFLIASPFRGMLGGAGWSIEKTPFGLESYLTELGVTFGEDLVCDNHNFRLPRIEQDIMMRGRSRLEMEKYPFFVRVLRQNMSQESVLTRLMPDLLLPCPSEIKLDTAKLKGLGLQETVLARTSEQSWTHKYSQFISLDALRYDETKQNYEPPKSVLVSIEGQFPFSYEGKPVPEWPHPATQPKPEDKKPEIASVTKQPGMLVLCSAPEGFFYGYLANQQIGPRMQGNIGIIVNLADKLTKGEDLIKLRSKHLEARTIDTLVGKENEVKRSVLQVALVLGIPFLVVVFALARTGLRHARQIHYERKFSQTSGPSSFTP